VLKDFHNIEKRDALLTWESTELRKDEDGKTVTRWDKESHIKSNVTGEDIPDLNAQVEIYNYNSPDKVAWPEAEFIIGNPPFLGSKKMRDDFGDGYVEALQTTYKKLSGDVNFVMYWWHKASQILQRKSTPLRRFGFITTDTIKQVNNRKVIQDAISKGKISLSYAIKDHPWIDSSDGASVRIAMTVARRGGALDGKLEIITHETRTEDNEHIAIECLEKTGIIYSNLQVGVNVSQSKPLKANDGLSFQGVKLVGAGFQISPSLKSELLSTGEIPKSRLPRYWNCTDIHKSRKERSVIDFTGLSKNELSNYPKALQVILDKVKKYRDSNPDDGFREKWWLFGRPRYAMRAALNFLPRYIATGEVTKHRTFIFLEKEDNLIDGGAYCFASDSPSLLSNLSSKYHVIWTLAAGGDLGVTPRYNNTLCFDPFPHDDIDAATAQAYGWPADLPDEEILKRLVALNKERALEEAKGHIRWLRPEYQNPDGQKGKAKTTEMVLDEPTLPDAIIWPKELPQQMGLVREALLDAGQASVEDIRSQFKRAQTKTIKDRLDTLAALGQAEILEDGRYAA